ncbi:Ig-like domain-containing protein [Clostridium sp. ZS2-4]|uniref:Ig-like domain-containing protein n=1 Tax=Clostridium sp. ZS2-4 TaxID=2987703 RepID=UPI00227B008F|nr:Ig-like domain-containing protein [Clostridium sp. ZS2-4]MCY6355127.1 Ig-like domain-containing protein [Clostridium sp. ZS2-4]
MAKQKKVVNVLSTAALAGLVTSAMLSSQAFAKVDAYTVKVGDAVYKYDKADLVASFLDNSEGIDAPLYQDFTSKVSEGKGVYAFHDDKSGYVSFGSVADAFAAAEGTDFDMNAFTESDKAEVVTVSSVKKAVVVDGKVNYNDEGESSTGELKVESVSAINAAQIKVTFNKTLTGDAKDEATDEDNYTLKNSKDDEIDDIIKSVDVEEGSREAIITVNYNEIGTDDEDYQNQAEFKLVLDEKIAGKEIEKKFKVSDFETPEVKSVEVAGIRTIKVKLSEPIVSKGKTADDIYNDLEEAFKINDGDYSIDKIDAIDNGKELNIVLFSDLKDGQKIKVEVKSEATDYAGYSLKKDTFDATVNVNKEELAIVSYEKAKDSEITLVFNKDIKFHDYKDDTKIALKGQKSKYGKDFIEKDDDDFFESFYHTTAKNQAEAVEIDGNKLTLYFDSDHTLPETAYVTVDADTLEDLWEKKNNSLVTKAQITKDMVKPEVKEIEQDDDSNRKIKITFTEDMEEESATKASNYTVKDENKKEIRVHKARLDGDEVTLELTKDLEDGDKYKVTIEDVEDKAGNKIADVTKEFVAKETQAVDSVNARFYDAGESNQKIVVDFDTKMLADGSRYAINTLDNYDLNLTLKNGKDYSINLSDYDDASIKAVENDHKVEIKLPGNKADNDERFNFNDATKIELKINKVEDTNENKSAILEHVKVNPKNSDISLDSDNDQPVAIDRETIKVTFEDEFKKFEDKDISLQYGTLTNGKFSKVGELEEGNKKVKTENGNTVVEYTLKEAEQLNYNGTYKDQNYVVAVVTKENPKDIKSENRYGDTLAANQTWIVKDEIAPELAKLAGKDDPKPEVIYGTKIDDREDYKDAVIVSGYANKQATVKLYFEEDIRDIDNMKPYMFDTKDDDIDVVDVKSEGNHTIVLTLDASDSDDKEYTKLDDFVGVTISTGNNEVFDMLSKDPNKSKVDAVIEVEDKKAVQEDKVAPVITGVKDLTLTVGDTFTETAKATDNVDGTVEVKVEGTVDTTKAATYTLNYTATDKSGNKATATRKVVVKAKDEKPSVDVEKVIIVNQIVPGKAVVIVELKDVDSTKYSVTIDGVEAKFSNGKFAAAVDGNYTADTAKDLVKVTLK